MELSPATRAFAAVAIRAYARDLKRNGQAVPPELLRLADALFRPPDAPNGQGRPKLAVVTPPTEGENRRPLKSTGQAAALLGVSERFVRRAAAAGELTSVHIGRCLRFRDEDITAYVERRASSGRSRNVGHEPGSPAALPGRAEQLAVTAAAAA
jgi:excisionase family DNA binding protein